jgi:hypothetical protein
MKVIIWKKKNNQYDDQPRWRIASVGYGKGNLCMGNAPHRHWLTISLRRAICRFRTEPRKLWACILGLEISYKQSLPNAQDDSQSPAKNS